MPKVSIYSLQGKLVGEKELDPKIFGIPVNKGLLHQVLVSLQANSRRPIAHTKTRAEVRGGGKKPWRQKGTGRARHGSTRSPIWKGGGQAHGPRKDKIFAQKINKQMSRLALKMAFSDKIESKQCVLAEHLNFEPQKTKSMALFLRCLPFLQAAKGKSFSILVGLASQEFGIRRIIRNLAGVRVCSLKGINVLDLVGKKYCLMSVAGLEELKSRLSGA